MAARVVGGQPRPVAVADRTLTGFPHICRGHAGEGQDVESLNHYATAVAAGRHPEDVLDALRRTGRDNARTPMQWDSSPHAGFTSGTPWFPVNPNHEAVNAAAQREDPTSVLAHYRRLIALRHQEPVVAHGDFTLLLPDDERIWAFTRRLGDVEWLVLGNVSGDVVDVPLPSWAGARVLLSNVDSPADLVLQPWEGRICVRP